MQLEKERKQSLHDELAKEHIGPAAELKLAKAADPKAQADPPGTKILSTSQIMSLDPKHDQEIKQKLNDAAKAYFQIPFEQCTPLQKAETIQRALKDPDFFNFQYDKNYNGPPRTVEETYTSEPKSGNCDELSRLFLAIASKEYVDLKNLSQFYVTFKSETTGNEVGHTAIFYIQGSVVFIDPGLNEFTPLDGSDSFPKKFKSPEETVKDPDFKKYILGLADRATDEKGPFVIEEIGYVKGSANADVFYHFNYGNYMTENATKKEDWEKAIEYFNLVIAKGVSTALVYSRLGQAYLHATNYEKAEQFCTRALEKRGDAQDYANRGFARFKSGKYERARQDFEEQLKLEPDNIDARVKLGATHVDLAFFCMEKKDYNQAYEHLQKAKLHLFTALRSGTIEDTEMLFDNLEAFFTNQYTTLIELKKTDETNELKQLYNEARGLGFKSEKIDDLFK
jgi:tetratricopeptide (TPR) repeat protein